MFDIKGNKIVLDTDELAIPPFKDYYNNAKNKTEALKDIEYIIWRYKWNTPYEAYPEKERTQRIAKDIFKVDNWEEPSRITELAKRFIEFQETPGTRLLTASNLCNCTRLSTVLLFTILCFNIISSNSKLAAFVLIFLFDTFSAKL